ncbi:hypothetical protein IGI37_002921 [Enterococcus sp. AZ194]|uniref:hypothetical protein n=1 Tax=Enterococcus sp. AZ194 TaxID=2774629 RepID=UPI003F296253
MGKSAQKEKIKWLAILFLAVGCFVLALTTQQVLFNLITILLAIVVYRFGQPILFKEYDEKRKKKYEEAIKIRQAAQEAVVSKKVFKNKKVG